MATDGHRGHRLRRVSNQSEDRLEATVKTIEDCAVDSQENTVDL